MNGMELLLASMSQEDKVAALLQLMSAKAPSKKRVKAVAVITLTAKLHEGQPEKAASVEEGIAFIQGVVAKGEFLSYGQFAFLATGRAFNPACFALLNGAYKSVCGAVANTDGTIGKEVAAASARELYKIA